MGRQCIGNCKVAAMAVYNNFLGDGIAGRGSIPVEFWNIALVVDSGRARILQNVADCGTLYWQFQLISDKFSCYRLKA